MYGHSLATLRPEQCMEYCRSTLRDALMLAGLQAGVGREVEALPFRRMRNREGRLFAAKAADVPPVMAAEQALAFPVKLGSLTYRLAFIAVWNPLKLLPTSEPSADCTAAKPVQELLRYEGGLTLSSCLHSSLQNFAKCSAHIPSSGGRSLLLGAPRDLEQVTIALLAYDVTLSAAQKIRTALQAKDRKRAAQLLELESGPFPVM